MNTNKINYINNYNKQNYKMYQFRVKNTDTELISFLDSIENRSSYIVSLIENNSKHNVLTIKEIKKIIKPILKKYGIEDIYIFGSYSRGEAKPESDVDIYCEKGNIKSYFDQSKMEEELEQALNKKVDIIFIGSEMTEYFKKQIMEDMIKLC